MMQDSIYLNLFNSMFRLAYPRYPNINKVFVSTTEREYHMDLRPIMNTTPITCLHSTCLPQMFNLFRALGLRHMLVLNDDSEVVGVVTRKDLARFRVKHQAGHMERETVHITEEVQ